jgi:hypothetical protein
VGYDDVPSLFPDAMTTVVRDSSPIKVSLAKLNICYVVSEYSRYGDDGV